MGVDFADLPAYDNKHDSPTGKNDTGITISKYRMLEELRGQLKVLEMYALDATYIYNGNPVNSVGLAKRLCDNLTNADSIQRVTDIESFVANIYWGVISKTPVQFKKRELAKIPEHWRTFGTRHSLINHKANHNATNPANAMLNYLYALLYSETRLALMRAGFDTTAGIFHADSTKRESFVTDVMEAVRSDVDLWLLEYIRDHAFSAKEFYEKKDGGVRLTLKLAPVLAGTVPLWAKKVEPVVMNLSKFMNE